MAAAAARVGRRDELETGGEVADAARARDRDPPVLERLAQRLEHVLLKLGQLIEEENPEVGERDLARMRRTSASDEARYRDRVVRRAERAAAHQLAVSGEQARDGPDGRRLDHFLATEG